MPEAVGRLGAEIIGESEHRAGDGRLISKQVTIKPPKIPDAPKPPDPNCRECINQYIRDFDKWSKRCKELAKEYEKIMEYHAKRIEFAEKYRNAEIPEKYRTGEPSPTTGVEAEREMRLLKDLEKEVRHGPGTSSFK